MVMDNATIANLKREQERHVLIAQKIGKLLEEIQALENGKWSSEPAASVSNVLEARQNGNDQDLDRRFAAMTQADAVETVINIQGGRATVSEIFQALKAGGMIFPNTGYVSTILSRYKKKFRQISHGNWALVQPEFFPNDNRPEG